MRLIMEQDVILAVQKEEEEVGTTRNVSVPSLHSLSHCGPFSEFSLSLSVSLSLSRLPFHPDHRPGTRCSRSTGGSEAAVHQAIPRSGRWNRADGSMLQQVATGYLHHQHRHLAPPILHPDGGKGPHGQSGLSKVLGQHRRIHALCLLRQVPTLGRDHAGSHRAPGRRCSHRCLCRRLQEKIIRISRISGMRDV